jgi:hypothetical protein
LICSGESLSLNAGISSSPFTMVSRYSESGSFITLGRLKLGTVKSPISELTFPPSPLAWWQRAQFSLNSGLASAESPAAGGGAGVAELTGGGGTALFVEMPLFPAHPKVNRTIPVMKTLSLKMCIKQALKAGPDLPASFLNFLYKLKTQSNPSHIPITRKIFQI